MSGSLSITGDAGALAITGNLSGPISIHGNTDSLAVGGTVSGARFPSPATSARSASAAT